MQYRECLACRWLVPNGNFCDQCGERLDDDDGPWWVVLAAWGFLLAIYAVGALTPIFG